MHQHFIFLIWFHYMPINLVWPSTHCRTHLFNTRAGHKTKAPGTHCLGVSHHHTICKCDPFLKMFSQTIICSFKAQTTDKQFFSCSGSFGSWSLPLVVAVTAGVGVPPF